MCTPPDIFIYCEYYIHNWELSDLNQSGGINIKQSTGAYVKFQNDVGEFITGAIQYVEDVGQSSKLYINGTDGWAYCISENDLIGMTA